MKFLCDDMLGTLAKWLRILGYDTRYGGKNDQDLIDISVKENRVLLTRDKELYQRTKNKSMVLYVDTIPLDHQLAFILKKTGVTVYENRMFTRCTQCNIPVEKINKDIVQNKIPAFVFQNHRNFWRCPRCFRIYWKGSHWENIVTRTKNLVQTHKLSR